MNDNVNATKKLKREILVRLVKAFMSDNFAENVRLIPYVMRPKGSEVPFRCCIYKERAILRSRAIAGLGFAMEDDDEATLLSDFAKKAVERARPESDPLTVLQNACQGALLKALRHDIFRRIGHHISQGSDNSVHPDPQ